MSPCKCCRRACKRPLCRWPNLAQASERTGSNDKNPRRSRPPRRTQQCPHRSSGSSPSPPSGTIAGATAKGIACQHTPFFKPEVSHWHHSCSLFHVSKSDLFVWPGRQEWFTPRCRHLGSKPEACERSWPCDVRGKSEVGLAARSLFLKSHSPRKHVELC